MAAESQKYRKFDFIGTITLAPGITFSTTLKDVSGTLGTVLIVVDSPFFIIGMSMKRKEEEESWTYSIRWYLYNLSKSGTSSNDLKMNNSDRNLEEQRTEFISGKFLATPLAGLIVWLIVGISGMFLPVTITVWVLFIGTGSIIYLALFLSKFTGENFLDKSKPKNEFDKLFFMTVGQAVLVYAIAIPFFMIDYSSLPLTVGVLTGTMWLPFSWIIKHWVGIFHAITRTVMVVSLWYIFPDQRFVVIPFAIVLIYLVTLFILSKRIRE